MEKKKLTIVFGNQKNTQELECFQGQKLLTMLQEQGVYISAICNGNGTCGKCKIRVLEGSLPITEADKKLLTETELETGVRLACKAEIENELCLESADDREEQIIVTGVLDKEEMLSQVTDAKEQTRHKKQVWYGKDRVCDAEAGKRKQQSVLREHFIAIDIGTTTIAMALVESQSDEIIDTYTTLNHQRAYGADVISRIVAANAGKSAELKRVIEEDLWKGILTLIKAEDNRKTEVREQNNIAGSEEALKGETEVDKQGDSIYISRILIAGNTTMIHLLMGYSCEGLGKYPFKSDHLDRIDIPLQECITKSEDSEFEDVPATILPGISAFVGSDVTADLLVCPEFETEEITLLIDLGTNGEMVLGNRKRLLFASTAAGPAFEGGNIACGTGGVPGAVSQVKIQNRRAIIRTINNKMPPTGICGTGLISAIAQLKQNRFMDKYGTLRYPYNDNGYPLWVYDNGERIAVYQQDIRQFQMAKAAIRAGMEQLMEEYGCRPEDIRHVFFAGGFGTNLSIEDVICTGIIPDEFQGKVKLIGNGALQGAIEYGVSLYKDKIYRVTACVQQTVGETGNDLVWHDERQIINSLSENRIQSVIKKIKKRGESLSLAEKENFREKYIKYMDF